MVQLFISNQHASGTQHIKSIIRKYIIIGAKTNKADVESPSVIFSIHFISFCSDGKNDKWFEKRYHDMFEHTEESAQSDQSPLPIRTIYESWEFYIVKA